MSLLGREREQLLELIAPPAITVPARLKNGRMVRLARRACQGCAGRGRVPELVERPCYCQPGGLHCDRCDGSGFLVIEELQECEDCWGEGWFLTEVGEVP
ncbi:MAG: hypothetical protein J2P45_21865 [Candidatus Dormibacteraeota bacterium]|nr:hypothetical protein [Candidatus Dormibacteraeota bacterium]